MLEEQAISKELVGAEATRFRAIAARANYFAADKPHIQYAVKEICRRLAEPAAGGWQKSASGQWIGGEVGSPAARSAWQLKEEEAQRVRVRTTSSIALPL